METTLAPAEVDLSLLPEVLQKNEALAERAVAAMEAKLDELPQDLKAIPVLEGDTLEEQVNELRQRGVAAEKMNRERRMVFTREFDRIKMICTANEKHILSCVQRLKTFSDSWNVEKHNRAKAAEQEAEKKQRYEEAKIDFSNYIQELLYSSYKSKLADTVERMNTKFNSCNLSNLDNYVEELKKYHPQGFQSLPISFQNHPLLDGDISNDIVKEAEREHTVTLSNLFIENVEEEKQRLIELAPSRKAELQRIQNDAAEAKKAAERIAKEEVERKANLDKEEAERKAKSEQEANTEKLNNMLENAAAQPAVQLSKGTQVKLKYTPENHKQMISIIQWWVANCMNLLTVEELMKKFSFMLTAANKELNKGTAIEGVATIEDISTRTRRKKKEA